ncbi:MAG: 4Fe-4S binding protein, partial [Coriobacteriales bacterium]|nr:4Fe-4S binding protein [Coriobacteriales bacterium]
MSIVIDKDLCIGCGSCVNACPLELIALTGDTAQI